MPPHCGAQIKYIRCQEHEKGIESIGAGAILYEEVLYVQMAFEQRPDQSSDWILKVEPTEFAGGYRGARKREKWIINPRAGAWETGRIEMPLTDKGSLGRSKFMVSRQRSGNMEHNFSFGCIVVVMPVELPSKYVHCTMAYIT